MYSRNASIRLKAKHILRSASAWLSPVALLLTASSVAHATTPPTVTFAGLQVTLTSSLQGSGGVAADAAGNVFIADTAAHQLIELPAGGGAQIVLASGLEATAVAVGSAGKLYVSVYDLDHLLVYTPGSASAPTSLGSGFQEPNGVSIDVHGNIYVSDTQNNQVVELPAGGGAQTVIGSGLKTPFAAAADSAGNVYVADQGNGRLVEFLAAGGSVDIENGINPIGLAIDQADNIFYSDHSDSKVYELPAKGGMRTITQGIFNLDTLSTDNAGNLYASIGGDGDGSALEIQLGAVDLGKINVCSTSGTTPASCTSSVTLNFNVDAGTNGYASLDAKVVTQGGEDLDYTLIDNTCTGLFESNGTCSVTIQFAPLAPGTRLGAVNIFGDPSDDPTPAVQASVYLHGIGLAPQAVFDAAPISTLPITMLNNAYPYGITVAANGDIYYLDYHNCVLQKYSGSTVSVVAGTGTCASGTPSGDGSAATSATFEAPQGVAVDGSGNIYVADYGGDANNVRRIDALTGIISTVAGTGTYGYTPDGAQAAGSALKRVLDIALDGAGNLYLAEPAANLIRKVDAHTGVLSTVAGNYQAGTGYSGDHGLATDAQLNYPNSLVVDSSGNIYIADTGNNAIRKVSAGTGIITTIAGLGPNAAGYSGDGGPGASAAIYDPEGVSVDAAGNVYIADANNFVVRKVSATTGVITTVAGVYNQNETYTGDGGSALKAGLSYLERVAIDNNGNLLIVDFDNRVIRKVATGGAIAGFGMVSVGSSSAAQDVTLTNNGSSALDLSALTPSANFNLNGSDTSCNASTTLAAGASCILGIKFLPTAAGALTGSITLTDNVNNDPTSTQSVALSGTGVATPGQPVSTSKIVVSTIPVAITQGGNLGTVTATLETSTGSVITNGPTAVTLTITGPGGFSVTKTATTVNGISTFDLTGTPLSTAGTYSVVVSSSGQPSQTFPVVVGQDFTLAPAPGSSTGSGSVPTQTVQPGSPAVYPLVLAPAGTVFSAPITLTATGLPPGATYSFSPAVITPGSASAATTLTVHTAKTTAALERLNGFGGTLEGLALAAFLLPLAGSRRWRSTVRRMPLGMVAFALLSGTAVLGLTGCGVGGLFGHQPSNFTITVVGTSGTISHSTTVHLTIQ